MMGKVTLEFNAKPQSAHHNTARMYKGLVVFHLYRVTAEGGRRESEKICDLARFDFAGKDNLDTTIKFWRQVDDALVPYLSEMGDSMRKRVYKQLARWVAHPTEDEITAFVDNLRGMFLLPRKGEEIAAIEKWRRSHYSKG